MGEENGFISSVHSVESIYCVSSRVSSLFIRLHGRLKGQYVVLKRKFTLRIRNCVVPLRSVCSFSHKKT